MKRLLDELHAFDPNSTAFRYARDQNGALSLRTTMTIDLANVRLQMARAQFRFRELEYWFELERDDWFAHIANNSGV